MAGLLNIIIPVIIYVNSKEEIYWNGMEAPFF